MDPIKSYLPGSNAALSRRTAFLLSALIVSVGATGCTALLGAAGEEDERESVPGDEAALLDITETDEELKATDPELFNLAVKYFPKSDSTSPPARFYRLTRRQLDLTASVVFPDLELESALDLIPPDPLIRNYELASDLGFQGANFTPYRLWVDTIVADVLAEPALVVDCADAADTACLSDAARAFVSDSFRGIASEEAKGRYVDFFLDGVGAVGLEQATADFASVVMTSPHFSFREEVNTSEAGILLPAQALQNLTYTLADVPPSQLGLDANSASQVFSSEEAVEAAVSEILKSPFAREKLVRFFVAWLEIKDADKFDMDPGTFPEFTEEVAQGVVEETTRFLTSQLTAAAPKLSDMTESTESFVSAAVADIYGTDGGTGDTLLPLDPNERRGFFTQPAFIASHSGPIETRLVKRGAFFTKKVMCQELGDPPDGSIPTGVIPGNTERERIEGVTEPPSCAGCHTYINPFGFMMESYDAIGRFRTEDEHGYPIDPSTVADFLDEGPVDEVRSVDALARFTESAMFRQCFVRQVFTFYSGRRPEDRDHPTLREMFFRFSEGTSEDLIQLLTLLVTSHNFSRRTEEN